MLRAANWRCGQHPGACSSPGLRARLRAYRARRHHQRALRQRALRLCRIADKTARPNTREDGAAPSGAK